jgi:hypothetical protein
MTISNQPKGMNLSVSRLLGHAQFLKLLAQITIMLRNTPDRPRGVLIPHRSTAAIHGAAHTVRLLIMLSQESSMPVLAPKIMHTR